MITLHSVVERDLFTSKSGRYRRCISPACTTSATTVLQRNKTSWSFQVSRPNLRTNTANRSAGTNMREQWSACRTEKQKDTSALPLLICQAHAVRSYGRGNVHGIPHYHVTYTPRIIMSQEIVQYIYKNTIGDSCIVMNYHKMGKTLPVSKAHRHSSRLSVVIGTRFHRQYYN
jgi:hypothetical protein